MVKDTGIKAEVLSVIGQSDKPLSATELSGMVVRVPNQIVNRFMVTGALSALEDEGKILVAVKRSPEETTLLYYDKANERALEERNLLGPRYYYPPLDTTKRVRQLGIVGQTQMEQEHGFLYWQSGVIFRDLK